MKRLTLTFLGMWAGVALCANTVIIDGKSVDGAKVTIETAAPVVIVPPPPVDKPPAEKPPVATTVTVNKISWPPGDAYNTVFPGGQGAEKHLSPGSTAAWKIPAASLFRDNVGAISLYSFTNSAEFWIATVPGAAPDKSQFGPYIAGSSGKMGIKYVGPGHPATDSTLSAYGYKKLGPSIDGSYYIHIRAGASPVDYILLYHP